MTIAKGEITIIEVYDGADGTPSYTHIRYSANPNGNPMTEIPQPTTNYIGLYVSSSATAPSTYGTYSWTKIKGDTGKSLTEVISHWFATPLSSGVTHSAAWSTTPVNYSAAKPYLWRYEKFLWDDDPNDFTRSDPYIIGQYSKDGTDGKEGAPGPAGRSVIAVTTYWLATPAGSGVTRATSGWQTLMQTTTATDKYLWTYEKIDWSQAPTTTYLEPHIVGTYGDTGSQGSPGADGATAWTTTTAPAAPNYTFTKSNLNGPAGHTQKVGDLIFYSYYRYRVSAVTSTTVLATDRVSIQGADGQSAYEAAVAGGYTGTQTQFYTDLGLMQDLPETLESINDALDSYGTDIASILADKTISPPERIELRSTLLNVQRESAELYAKLEGEGVVAQALSAAASALTNALEEIVSAEGYSAIDFEALVDLFDDYASAVVNARNAVSVLTEEKFSDLTAGQVLLGSRIGKYEERLILEPDEITMTVDTDSGLQPVMTLSQDELAFYSEGQKVSYFANQRMMIENALVIQQLEVGNHVIEKYGSKFTIFRWVGE